MLIGKTSASFLDGRIDDFASSLLLFERMESVLELHLQAKPNDEKVISRLATCKRSQGKFNEALQLYTELSKHYPDNLDYPYAIDALTAGLHGDVPGNITRPSICPVFEWPDFLPEATIQQMVEHMCHCQNHFQPAQVGGGGNHEEGRYDPEARNNTALSLKGNPLKKTVRDLIAEKLPDITRRLGLSPFDASSTEVKLRAYHNGEYFRVHQDGGQGRLISYTYFFHPEPKRFDGGELVVFDTDTLTSTFNHSFSRIIPKRNSIYFFPSHYYHAVLPVLAQDDSFMSARFVINGHIWGKDREHKEKAPSLRD